MNDGWERPEPSGVPPVEVPLSGDGPLAVTAEDDGSASPPNWRKVVDRAALAGIAVGIAVAVVLMAFVWDDDEAGEGGLPGGPTTTADGSGLATSITTPPTLPGSDPVAVPDDTTPLTDPPETLTLPTTTAAPPPSPVETFGTIPDHPRFTGIPDGGLDSFDLAPAVARLGDDVARRSTTHLETVATDDTNAVAIEVTIVRDPVNDRYSIRFVGMGEDQHVVVDAAGANTYFEIAPGSWVVIPNSEVIAGLDTTDLPVFFDRMMFGPLRPDTVDAATVEPGSMVFFEGGDTIAREFAVELPGAVVPEWQLYALAPISAVPDELRPTALGYLAYVDDLGELSSVIGTASVGDTSQLVIHRLERLEPSEPVLLPDPDLVRPFDEFTD